MNADWNDLVSHLSRQATACGTLDGETLLEQLYFLYAENVRMDPPEIRNLFGQLESVLAPVPAELSNTLDVLICRLCSQHQKNAFLDGISLGFQLHSVLKGKP